MPLDYEALWELSKRQAERDVELMYAANEIERRAKKAAELTWRYYMQRVTPPRRAYG